jgi:hypothetical protein
MDTKSKKTDSDNSPESDLGCCKIKVRGNTQSYNSVTRKDCDDTAASLGGTVESFEVGKTC